MNKLLTKPWMTVPVGAIVYVAATIFFWKLPPAPKAEAEAAPVKPELMGASWQFTNPEADQLIAELKTEKEQLAKREQQLNELETRLQSEKSEMNEATQTVQQLKVDYDKMVLRVQTEETANLKKLAKVYATMAPDNAANILGQMEDPAIARIMIFMKEAETAVVLEALAKKSDADAKRAAALSERLRVAVFRSDTAK